MSATVMGEDPAAPAPRPSLPRRLIDRFGQLIHEIGKFGVVGVIAFVVDVICFNVASVAFDLGPLAAKTVSTTVAATVAFLGNRFWTWRHRERSGLAREYGLYFFFNAVGLGIALACLKLSHDVLGDIWPGFKSLLADNISGNIVGTALGSLFRFWAYRRYVFVAGDPAEPSADTPPTVDAPPAVIDLSADDDPSAAGDPVAPPMRS